MRLAPQMISDDHEMASPAETRAELREALEVWREKQLAAQEARSRIDRLHLEIAALAETQREILCALSPEARDLLDATEYLHHAGVLYRICAEDGAGVPVLSARHILDLT